jgi:hypothetical protein
LCGGRQDTTEYAKGNKTDENFHERHSKDPGLNGITINSKWIKRKKIVL